MSTKVGVIAEDDSDVAVIREITVKLLRPRPMGFRKFVGGGCGKLRRKCGAWARILVRQGCPWIVVVHDLDFYDQTTLRDELTEAIGPANPRVSVVLIPKHEIEAWLLYDRNAIARAFHEQHSPQLPGDPESIRDPKKFLTGLIWQKYRKEYLNTVHNELIARHIEVRLLGQCSSFAPHLQFIANLRALIPATPQPRSGRPRR